MARLTSPSGATVSVEDGKTDALLARGFTVVEEPKKATAKKTVAKKSPDDE